MTVKRKRPRTCVACRSECSKKELLRIVRTPEGDVQIDATGRKAGRGAYICLNKQCIEMARKKNSLAKALKIRVESDIYDELLILLGNEENGNK